MKIRRARNWRASTYWKFLPVLRAGYAATQPDLGRRPKHSWKPQNGSRRTIPRLLGPLRDNFLDRRAPHDLDAIGILQLRSDHQKYETRTRASFAYDARALVSPAASPEQTFRTHRPRVAPLFFCASMSPTEVKVTLIPPSGRIWGELPLAFRIRFINGSSFGWAQLAAATLPPLSYPRPPRWTPLCSMGNPTGPGLKTSSPYSTWSRPPSLPPCQSRNLVQVLSICRQRGILRHRHSDDEPVVRD